MTEEDSKSADISKANDPRLPFYITADLWADGSVDISSEGKDKLSLEAAIARAKEFVEEYGGEQFVVECRVIRKVQRGKTRIETFKTKPIR